MKPTAPPRSSTAGSAARQLARGHVRAARADWLYSYLEDFGGAELVHLHADLREFARADIERAVDDLVDDGRAFLEVRPRGIYVRPILAPTDVAEAA